MLLHYCTKSSYWLLSMYPSQPEPPKRERINKKSTRATRARGSISLTQNVINLTAVFLTRWDKLLQNLPQHSRPLTYSQGLRRMLLKLQTRYVAKLNHSWLCVHVRNCLRLHRRQNPFLAHWVSMAKPNRWGKEQWFRLDDKLLLH